MSFPGATPSYAGFTGSHTLSADNHASQHNSEQTDIIGLANKMGTGASTPTANLALLGNGAGTSAWGQVSLTAGVSGVLPIANGGTGASSGTGSGSPVFATSPTISTPTLTAPVIASFASANHDHSNSANGGSLGAVTATSLTTNTIGASGANHMALSAGTNKLVKLTVLRQDNTTDTYQVGNTVKLTGWGVMATGAAAAKQKNVTFGVTFLQNPIVTLTYGGDDTAGSTTYGQGGAEDKNASPTAHTITTTGFTARLSTLDATNWGGATTAFYQWTAEGEVA